MPLEAHRQTLQQLGFSIVEESSQHLVGVTRRFHWDCFFTRINYIFLLREIDTLDSAAIERDREDMARRASALAPSLLPGGLQKGTAVLAGYIARTVTPEARALCEASPKIRFAFFHIPAALDTTTGSIHFVRGTPVWGSFYYPKFRFLLGRVLEPERTPGTTWPLSTSGVALSLLYVALFLLVLTMLSIR
ncbi:MAG: hypothetical protein MUF64_01420 [Polyangiaceae bacterium]|jgi:hypothetical protein|nr:hypothetical protein [Polyangiaceae bacterium]